MRIAILGGPRTGKTTYATRLARKLKLPLTSTGKLSPDHVVRTDSFIGVGWDNVPQEVIKRLSAQEHFILEGCQAARVLRRWYAEDPDGPKLDRVIVFSKPHVPRTGGQNALAKGVSTILLGLIPTIKKAGVHVRFNPTE